MVISKNNKVKIYFSEMVCLQKAKALACEGNKSYSN